MMNEINKPNDIFVASLTNQDLNPLDLEAHGVTAQNTQLLTPEEYKLSKFVQKAFSDDKGNFDNDKFLNAYIDAANKYNDLTLADSYKKLELFVEYNFNDLYAPLGAKKANPSYEMQKEFNPTGVSLGITSLFERGTSDKSIRELALQSQIWDYDKQQWLDKTANDRGILDSIFGQSLVYASWDEDGEHEDPITGRKIKHLKGEWKLNSEGQYYTETLGSRSGAHKQFVAASDTLTSDDSVLNKIDFFDSDGLSKSAAGTTFKAMAKIFPYMIPGFNVLWGGTTAAIQMAGVLPTFAKMLEGIAISGNEENETSFTRKMNRWENYFKKFDSSYADDAQNSAWNYAHITDTVADIFSQLYQMRAAAKISELVYRDPYQQAVEKFQNKVFPKLVQSSTKEGSGLSISKKDWDGIFKMAVDKDPAVKAALEAQSKLSKSLSLGYMALTSSADVYQEALNGGYDRRTAGLAGLLATVGQYGIMMNEDVLGIGDWFLDKSVGYTTKANKGLITRALTPSFEKIKKAIPVIEKEATTKGKLGVISNLYHDASKGMQLFFRQVRDGSEPFWKNAMVEAVEEVTEEAVMDTTKGIFDILTWLGLGSNPDASFGVAQDFKSGNFLERYLQNAFGGFVGGALFEFQNTKVEPWIISKITGEAAPDLLPSLMRLIANGQTKEIMKVADELASIDGDIADVPAYAKDKQVGITANNGRRTRGEAAADVLKEYVKFLEGVLVDEGADLTDEQIAQKAIRDYQALKLLESTDISKLLIDDFTKLTSEIASIKAAIKSLEQRHNEEQTTEDKKEEKKEEKKVEKKEDKKDSPVVPEEFSKLNEADLLKELEKRRKEIAEFLEGKKAYSYVKKALAFLTPEIKTATGLVNKYDFAELKYGVDYATLYKNKGTITRDSIDKEYEEWRRESDITKKFLSLGIESFEDFREKFLERIVKYADKYADMRANVISKVLHLSNKVLDKITNNDDAYDLLTRINDGLRAEGIPGITLGNIFLQDELKLKSVITSIVDGSPAFLKLLNKIGQSKEQAIDVLAKHVGTTLSLARIDQLQGLSLEGLLVEPVSGLVSKYFNDLINKDPNLTVGELYNLLVRDNIISELITLPQELAASTDKAEMIKLFSSIVSPKIKLGQNVGISTSVLLNYLAEQKELDAEIVKEVESVNRRRNLELIKQIKLEPHGISGSLQIIDFDTNEQEERTFFPDSDLSDNSKKLLYDAINNADSNRSISEILDGVLEKIAEDDLYFYAFQKVKEADTFNALPDSTIQELSELPTLEKEVAIVKELILDLLSLNPYLELYDAVKNKPTLQNDIYEGLREIDFLLSEGKKSKVLELLQLQSNRLQHSERFSDYLPPSVEREELENALNDLEMVKAIAVAMRSGDLSLGDPFNMNQQLNRFKDKWGINEKDLPTISRDKVETIKQDVDLIAQLIRGYLNLAARSVKTKGAMEAKIREEFPKAVVNYLLKKGSALTIKGVSFMPPKNELDKYQDNESKLAFLSSFVYKQFTENFKSAKAKREAIKEIVSALELNLSDNGGLADRSLKPSSLSEDFKAINDKDVINWLATSLSADTMLFNAKYNANIVSDEKNPYVPLYSQETVMHLAWAFSQDLKNIEGKNGKYTTVHGAIMEELEALMPSDKLFIISPYLMFIDGNGGAGKSSAVGSSVAAMNDGKLIYAAAKNETLLKNYVESIKSHSNEPEHIQSGTVEQFILQILTKEGLNELDTQIEFLNDPKNGSKEYLEKYNENTRLFDRVLIKSSNPAKPSGLWKLNTNNLAKYIRKSLDTDLIPEILLVDEATHISQPYALVLGFIGEQFDVKVFLSGNFLQKGVAFTGDPQALKDLYMWTPPKMSISVRSSNNLKTNNSIEFGQALDEYEIIASKHGDDVVAANAEFLLYLTKNPIHISYFEDKEKDILAGDKFVDSLTGHKEDINRMAKLLHNDNRKNPDKKGKIIIITKLNESNDPVRVDDKGNIVEDEALRKLILDCKDLLPEDYEFMSPDDAHKLSVQGSEANYVIVNDTYAWGGSAGENLRALYTYAGRSLKASLIACDTTKLLSVNVHNLADKRTVVDEIPQLADIKNIKQKRKEQLNKLLTGTDFDLTLKKVKTKKIKDIDTPIRSTAVPRTTSNTSTDTTTKTEDAGTEADLNTEELVIVAQALANNPETNNDEDDPLQEADANMTNSDTEALRDFSPKDSIKAYLSMDHIGVAEDESNPNNFWPSDPHHLNLDFAGLTQPGRFINPIIITGFHKFRNLVAFAESKDEIVEGIANDDEIAAFLAEINLPYWYNNSTGYTSDKTSTINPVKKMVMSRWFRDHVEFDDNLYVIAKRFDPTTDLPHTINGAEEKYSVGKGNVALYFGIHMKSDDGVVNQWISLGSLPKKTYVDKSGNVVPVQLSEFLSIYAAAEKSITPTNAVLMTVFRLPNTKVYSLLASSTLRFRAQEPDEHGNKFRETLRALKRRGIIVDTDNMYLIDSEKVMCNGKEEFKALVIIAGLDSLLTEDPYNQKFGMKSLPFEEKLDRLKKKFVRKDGSLRIAGQYLTFANFVNVANKRSHSKAFRRVLLLEPFANDPSSVFLQLNFDPTKHPENGWAGKLSKARPYSQYEIMIDLLNNVEAFANPTALYMNMLFVQLRYPEKHGPNSRDRKALKNIVDWLLTKSQNQEVVTEDEFRQKLIEESPRTLLAPFYWALVGHTTEGNYFMYNVSKGTIKKDDAGIETVLFDKSSGARKELPLEKVHDGFTSLPIAGKAESGEDLDLKFFDGKFSEIAKVEAALNSKRDPLSLFKVVYTPDLDLSIGTSAFLLQTADFKLTANDLADFEELAEEDWRLPLLLDSDRFVAETHLNGPEKPEDFDPLKYRPQQLKDSESYVVDKALDTFVITSEVGSKYKHLRQKSNKKRKITTKGKKAASKRFVYNPKTKKWELKHSSNWIKDKDGKWVYNKKATTTKKEVSVRLRRKSGNKEIPIEVTNAGGFRIRIGDIVQLYGDPNQTYRVDNVSVQTKTISINKVGDAWGNGMQAFDKGKTYPADAVTKMVKRALPSKHTEEFKKKDVYYTGNFEQVKVDKFNELKDINKSYENFLRLFELDDSGFNFESNWYLIVPITESNKAYMRDPLRDFPNRQWAEGIQTMQIYALDEEGLKAHMQAYSLKEGVIGATIYRIAKPFVTKEGEHLGFKAGELTKAVYDAIRDAERSQTREKKGSWIKHQVFFTEDALREYVSGIEKSTYVKLKFNAEEVWEAVSKPEEKINLVNPRTSPRIAKGLMLTLADYTNRKKDFPENAFYHEFIKSGNTVTGIILYPKPEFFTGAKIKDYNGFTEGNLAYDTFIMGLDIDYSGVKERFKELIGLTILDNIGVTSKSEEETASAKDSAIIRGGEKALKLTISDISYYDNGMPKLEFVGTTRTISLKAFLIGLGARYEILPDAKVLTTVEEKTEETSTGESLENIFDLSSNSTEESLEVTNDSTEDTAKVEDTSEPQFVPENNESSQSNTEETSEVPLETQEATISSKYVKIPKLENILDTLSVEDKSELDTSYKSIENNETKLQFVNALLEEDNYISKIKDKNAYIINILLNSEVLDLAFKLNNAKEIFSLKHVDYLSDPDNISLFINAISGASNEDTCGKVIETINNNLPGLSLFGYDTTYIANMLEEIKC